MIWWRSRKREAIPQQGVKLMQGPRTVAIVGNEHWALIVNHPHDDRSIRITWNGEIQRHWS